jgi:effector-binding domain-containing protein
MKTKVSIYFIGIVFLAVSAGLYKTEAQTGSPAPKIEVKDIAAQKAISIRVTVPSANVGPKMGELYGKLFSYAGTNNIAFAGAPFAVYYSYDPKGNTEFEVGLPVNTTAQGTEEIKFKEYPAMKVISLLHVGPYEQVGPTYEALKKYATDNKLETQPISWEIYLTDPMQEKDPAKYQTYVYFVIK